MEGNQEIGLIETLKRHNAGYLEELTPVSGFRIQKDAAGVNLVGLEVKAPNGSVARYARGHCCIVRGTFRQIIPQIPGTEPPPWAG